MNARARATIHGWLLLLPAMACLALFTHWPAVASFIDSLHSTPKARRPARFVGIESLPKRVTRLPKDVDAVKRYISQHCD